MDELSRVRYVIADGCKIRYVMAIYGWTLDSNILDFNIVFYRKVAFILPNIPCTFLVKKKKKEEKKAKGYC